MWGRRAGVPPAARARLARALLSPGKMPGDCGRDGRSPSPFVVRCSLRYAHQPADHGVPHRDRVRQRRLGGARDRPAASRFAASAGCATAISRMPAARARISIAERAGR